MKRIITSVVLVVLVFALAFYGKWLAHSGIGEIQNAMKQIETELADGEKEKALQLSENFLEEWERHHKRLCLFLQHDHLDPLENIFALLPYYIRQDEIILARAECRTVQTVTEHILKAEQVTLENIL